MVKASWPGLHPNSECSARSCSFCPEKHRLIVGGSLQAALRLIACSRSRSVFLHAHSSPQNLKERLHYWGGIALAIRHQQFGARSNSQQTSEDYVFAL